MFKTKKSDIIISGAGTAGLTLGLLLADAGLQITFIDPIKSPSSKMLKLPAINTDIGTRTTAVMNDNLALFDKIGISDVIAPYCDELRALQIIDADKDNDHAITFAADELDLTRFGLNIPNVILLKALMQKALKHKNITLHFENEITTIENTQQNVNVTLSAGKILNAKLLIGADGRNSKTRELANIAVTTKQSGQQALTCILGCEHHHNFTSTEFHYEGGPFTLVPLPDNTVSLVWVEKDDQAEYWMAEGKDDQEAEINARSKALLGHLSVKTPIEAVPLTSSHAEKLWQDRIVLIAEAAHVLHPMGAQGLNTSLRDVAQLYNEIYNALSCGIDCASPIILKKYADARMKDSSLRNNFSYRLNKYVANDSGTLKMLRRFGLKTLEKHSVLRHMIMRYGLAPYKAA